MVQFHPRLHHCTARVEGVRQWSTSLILSEVRVAHVFVQERLQHRGTGVHPGFLDSSAPWNLLQHGGPPGPWALGGAVWRKALDYGATSDLLSVKERMVLSVRPVFLLVSYASKGWSLVLLASSLARSFRCPGILYMFVLAYIVCAFRPTWGVEIPVQWNGMIYCTYPCIFLHFLACFLHVLSDSSDSEFPFSTSQFMK